MAIFVLAAYLGRRSPAAAGALTLASLPLYLLRLQVLGLPTTLLEAAVLGGVCGYFSKALLHLTKINFRSFFRHPYFPPILLISTASISAIFAAPNTIAALGVWRAYFLEPLISLPFIYLALKNPLYRSIVFKILAIETIIIALIALFQKIDILPIVEPWSAEHRATGVYPYPNALGLFVAPLIPLFAAIALFGKKEQIFFRITLAVAAAAGFIGIIFSQTEAAIGAVLISLTILGLAALGTIRANMTRVAIVAIVAIAVVIFVSLARGTLWEKLTFQDWSGTVRRVMWRETVAMLKTRPLLGAGLSGYPAAIAPFHADKKVEIFQYPHNEFLNVWSELGVLGVIGFLWLIASFIFNLRLRSTNEHRHLRIAAGLAMLALLIHGLVDVPYFKNDLAFLFWLVAILPFAARPQNLDSVKPP